MTSEAAPSSQDRLETLYLELHRAATISDHDKVALAADKILKKYPDEFKAFHCKIISLMQLEHFENSLKLINEQKDFCSELLFEKSYCEYRLNKLDDALTTISSANINDLRIQELLGQILYKQEKYEEALEKYKYLTRNVPDAYEEERTVNMTATVTAMSQWTKKRKDFPNVPENMFELCLNKACYMASLGHYNEAADKLKEAEEMCMHTFEGDQDVTAAEIDEELCVIKVQQAYCLQKMNKHQEANTIYHDILKKKCGDSQVLAVAANNVICINKDQNIFDSRKKIKMTVGDNVKQKLISQQRQQIAINSLLFQYYSNQGDSIKSTCDQILKTHPQCIRTALIKVTQLMKEKQTAAAIKFIEEYLDMLEKTDVDEDNLVRVQLTLAQLHLINGSLSKCNEILSDLPIIYRHKFGVLATRVSLFVITEDIQAALDCLDSAIDWYKSEASVLKKSKEKDDRWKDYEMLLKLAANFAIRHKMSEHGATYYEQLLQRNPNDQSILASLIAAYSRFDKVLAEKYISLLKDDKQLPEVDVDSLESAFIFGVKHMKKLLKGEVTPNSKSDKSAGIQEVKHKKKKKTKLPKNYDVSKMPDAERWLPKRERAHYKGKKRDKRSNVFRGPQGATSGNVDLDASKKLSAPATPSAEPIKKVAAAGSGSQQAKSKPGSAANKKNKNKKWSKR